MERERDEAYRIYVSDSLALYTRILTRDEVDIPRYLDMFKPPKKPETAEEVKARFNRLRRD